MHAHPKLKKLLNLKYQLTETFALISSTIDKHFATYDVAKW